MDRDRFKMIHSELIQQVQCIEYDLKMIYASMKQGEYAENYASVENANLGQIAKELKELDHSDDFPELTEEDYRVINEIRNIRNYWCHRCYLDFIYIQDDRERERKFQEIARRLERDESRTYALSVKTEQMRLKIAKKYM